MERLDAAVIGAGAVGLAVAARLAGAGREVAVLERHPRHGLETSSRSSEVIHGGLYYPPGSLKARLCVQGRRMLYDLAERRGFFVRKTGKAIVACEEGELGSLEALFKRGTENGVEGLEFLGRAAVQAKIPQVAAVAALWSPETGIMDTEELMRRSLDLAQDRGAIFLYGHGLKRVEPRPGGYRLWTDGEDEPIEARCVVNSAGLSSDRVAEMAGIDIGAAGYRLHWLKGEYFSLRRALAITTLVYPLPTELALGIHLTVDRQGRHRLGPNALPVQSLDYDVDLSHRELFWREASRYLPGLRVEDLSAGTAGIRPKLSAGGEFRDFVIAEESGRGLPGWVNLIGIDSPGLTASPAIAELVANLLKWPA